MWDGHMWGGHMGWGGMGLAWLLLIVLVCVVVWVTAYAARRSGNAGAPPAESPEQAVKRRYANGQIDRETYQRMIEDLRR